MLSEAHEQTFNERYENNFLARLRTMPEPVFRQCVFRVQDGESAIGGGSLNGQFRLMINDMMKNHAKACDRRLWLQATVAMNLQRLQLTNFLEEKLKAPIAEGTKISQVIIHAAEADMRAELADLNIRKAKQDAENEDLYGAINCAGELVKGQPAAVNSGPAPGTQSAVGETYLVAPAPLSEIIEACINISPTGRMITAAMIDIALSIMYSADMWREKVEEEAQSMRPTAGGNNVENGTMRESQGAAAQACATRTSPGEPLEAHTISSSGEEPLPAKEKSEEFFPVLIKSSLADRMAVCGVLEAMVMITEAENVFRKRPQIADPVQESDASTIPPESHYYISAENFELLQEMLNGWKRFSPVASTMCTRVLEIAIKAAQQDLIARGALA